MRMDKQEHAKKPVNLLLDAKLLKRAREEKINLSATFDKAIRQEILNKWRADTSTAFDENRKRIETEGLWSDGLRTW